MMRLSSAVFFIYATLFFLYPDSEKNWERQLDKYHEINGIIKENYINPINTKKNVFHTIRTFLKNLDPHSYFLDPITLRSIFEDQSGNYYGIGIRIIKYDDRLTVLSVVNGSPASKLGIYPGDIISEIQGMATAEMPIEEAAKRLRGSKGTQVSLTVIPQGIDHPVSYRIKRAKLPLNSISYAFPHPIESEIGYISIRTFGSTTPAEFRTNLRKLINRHQIKGLILDLRGNSGGSLIAAVEISDYFLEKGKVIVSLKSKKKEDKFLSKENNQFEGFPLVVLINRQSASASEIVASALKDHKKAIIVGTRSWGKGLVETVHRLPLNCAIALTTAKYYTPFNQNLQRDFSDHNQYFSAPLGKNYDNDESIKGGVIPDFIISDDQYPPFVTDLISRGIFFGFSRKLMENRTKIDKSFSADENIRGQFIRFLKVNKLESHAKKSENYLKWIQYEIERDIITTKFSPEEGHKIFLKNDPVTKKAVAVLKESIEKGA